MSRRLMLVAAIMCALAFCAIQASAAVTVLWQEGFEGYNTDAGKTYGGLDKNKGGSPNAANNGTGNPWFGPNPNNGWVTKQMTNPTPASETVNPHSGQFMMRGGRNASYWYNGSDNDIDHVNLGYRANGGQALQNNFSLDWYCYDILGNTFPGDPDKGPGCFGDYLSLEYRPDAPTNTDYVNNGSLADETAKLSLGAIEDVEGYDTSVYQAYVGGALINTNVTRSKGWRHFAIAVDKTGTANFYIDDALVLSRTADSADGFNVLTTRTCWSTPDKYNQSAYFDDITLAKLPEPGSMLAMASGLIALLGFARRRRS